MSGCAAVTGNVVQLGYLECMFEKVVGNLLAFGGILVFLTLLVGGYKYITSGGDPKGVESAKQTLTYAVLGLVFLAVSFLILKFIEVFTGANVTNFVIVR